MKRIEGATGLGDDPLWTFALSVYGRPRVAEACLALQDRHGADVNLLLYGLWAGARLGRTLAPDEIAQAVAAVDGWADAVVRPLRAIRRAMKTEIPGTPAELRLRLREEVKTTELAAERVQLAMLYALQQPATERRAPPVEAVRLAAANLLRLLGRTAPAASKERDLLAILVRAAVPDAAPDEVRERLKLAIVEER